MFSFMPTGEIGVYFDHLVFNANLIKTDPTGYILALFFQAGMQKFNVNWLTGSIIYNFRNARVHEEKQWT